jgi:hypothetical protein
MKVLAESAINFEQMAAAEQDPILKSGFERQYRKLVEKRAKEYGLNTPSERIGNVGSEPNK